MSVRSSTAGCTAVAALLVAGIVPGAAVASETRATTSRAAAAACSVNVGSVTAGGGHNGKLITVGSPPPAEKTYTGVFPAGAVSVASAVTQDPDVTGYGFSSSGIVVMGSTLYYGSYLVTEQGEVDRTRPTYQRIGGGWGGTTYFETTLYDGNPQLAKPMTQYALRADGTLSRWEMLRGTGGGYSIWSNKQTATGFAAVKTMAMISQTLTYDTFLANTRSGALYTIRLPRTSPLKPIVKKVRDSTWQGFDALVAEKCGQYGTLLIGIDKETRSGHLYAVGHANGTATVIQGLGKVAATFADPVYFRRQQRQGDAQMLFGE
ncbi:hypothetical protein AB0P21_06750 [Kribbella sp. NPDC056861]|uniref:hypothetical protein n=1 Tax=Kribbella sp. NPDC056861 TaxID=3154857 RepID=UPI00344932F3